MLCQMVYPHWKKVVALTFTRVSAIHSESAREFFFTRMEELGASCGLKRDQATRSASEPGLWPGTRRVEEAVHRSARLIRGGLQDDRLGRLSTKLGHHDAEVQWS